MDQNVKRFNIEIALNFKKSIEMITNACNLYQIAPTHTWNDQKTVTRTTSFSPRQIFVGNGDRVVKFRLRELQLLKFMSLCFSNQKNKFWAKFSFLQKIFAKKILIKHTSLTERKQISDIC